MGSEASKILEKRLKSEDIETEKCKQNTGEKLDEDVADAEAKMDARANFLKKFRSQNQINSVEFMRIWKFYDKDKSGYLDGGELDRFLKDLLEMKGEKSDPKTVAEYKEIMIQSFDVNRDGKLELSELAELLPVEENFLSKFPHREKLSREDFNEIFSHYDTNNSGYIGPQELEALIRDLFQKEGTALPANDLETYSTAVRMIYDSEQDGKLTKEEVGLILSKSK